MSWVQWFTVISGILAIGGVTIALGKNYLIPYLRKHINKPLDPLRPVTRNTLDYKDIPSAVALLAEKISSKRPDIVLGIDRGGAVVGGILAKYFRIPIRLLYRIESEEGFYSDLDASDVNGKVVVLVDDASRTGRSIEKAAKYVKSRLSPQSLVVAVLLLTKIDYRGHKEITPSELVDQFSYFTTRTDIKLPWDRGE
ncbi:MAG: phosphoribosyltransferase [Acidobacteria bacterium]|nr:phosphoribosyltransferase [Acidobacteriota bacterium]